MAWIGGVSGAGGAVAAGMQKHSNGKSKWIYVVSLVIALIALIIVISFV